MIELVNDRKTLAYEVVSLIKKNPLLKEKKQITLAIPGGTSMDEIFSEFSTAEISWEKIHIFWVDERLGDYSNYALAKKTFLHNLLEANIHPFLKTGYDELLKKYGGKFDILLLSAGEDGHVASIFPGPQSSQEGFFIVEDSPKPPPLRGSASLSLLQNSDYAFVTFYGEKKRQALENFKDPEISPEACPAKYLNKINNLYILTDLT